MLAGALHSRGEARKRGAEMLAGSHSSAVKNAGAEHAGDSRLDAPRGN